MDRNLKALKVLLLSLIIAVTNISVWAQSGNFPFYEFAKIYNSGDIMPKDQGGKFIQTEIFKTEDDAVIVQKIREGILYEIFGKPVGWEKFEKTRLETSVWVNRLYFLPSFARMYYLTKDKSYVKDMMTILNEWIKANPRVPGSERKSFNWRDMQVAWRSIHLSWCYYLTYDALSATDRKTIENIQRDHSEALLSWFARQPLNDFNHQSHGALAMLYLSTLFRDVNNTELLDNSMRILRHHIEAAHYPDGGNIEQMFGYFPFQTSIFRDMYLLCKANKIDYPSNLVPFIMKLAGYISDFAQPDATMPPLNDSYAVNVIPSVDILNRIFNKSFPFRSAGNAYYPDTQVAVMRSGSREKGDEWYILLNPARRIGSHAHAGRLGVYLWYGGNPVLIEAGCCNYDKPIKNRWYRTSKAHNTVLIDGLQDAESSSNAEYAKKRETGNRITEWIEEKNYTFCKMVSPKDDPTNNGVQWERITVLSNDGFAVIRDNFKATGNHSYQTLFHVPPVELSYNKADKSFSLYADSLVTIIPLNAEIIESVNTTNEYFYLDGSDFKAPMINYLLRGDGYVSSTYLIIPKSLKSAELKIEKEDSPNGTGVKIEAPGLGRRVLLFKNSDAAEINLFGERSTAPFKMI